MILFLEKMSFCQKWLPWQQRSHGGHFEMLNGRHRNRIPLFVEIAKVREVKIMSVHGKEAF